MISPAWLLIVPLLGVSFGYEPSSDSQQGYDYTVQLEPELVEQMQRGRARTVEANIPDEVTPIRRIRVVVGDGELPRVLRPAVARPTANESMERTAYRQDLDNAATPGTDLLAQTGPAGGFGRNATGFSGPPRDTTNSTVPVTVPPVDRSFQSLSGTMHQQLEAGFQAAQSGAINARNTLRESVNNVGHAGQQIIDNGRQALSDTVAPPDNRSFDSTRPPLENLGNRVQEEVRNTGEALRNSFDRTSDDDWGRPTGSRYDDAASVQAPASGNDRQRIAVPDNRLDRYTAGERSVLSDRWDDNPRTDEQQRQPLESLERREARQPERQRGPSDQTGGARATEGNGPYDDRLRFPAEPERQPSATGDARASDSSWTDWDNQPNRPAEQAPAAGDRSGQARSPSGNDNRNAEDNFWLPEQPASETNSNGNTGETNNGFDAPTIGSSRRPNTDEADVAEWLDDPSEPKADADDSSDDDRSSGSTPVWLLGWAIAVGSVVGNLFQWLNIVDLRNKYRVALRRSSPSFARNAA